MKSGYDAVYGKYQKPDIGTNFGFDKFSEGREMILSSEAYQLKNSFYDQSGYYSNVGSLISNNESYTQYNYNNSSPNVILQWIRSNGGSFIQGNGVNYRSTFYKTQPTATLFTDIEKSPIYTLCGDMLLGVSFSTLGSALSERRIGICSCVYTSDPSFGTGAIPKNDTSLTGNSAINNEDFAIYYENTSGKLVVNEKFTIGQKTYNLTPGMLTVGKTFFMKIDNLGYIYIGDKEDRLNKITTFPLILDKINRTDMRYAFFYQQEKNNNLTIVPNTGLIDVVDKVVLKYSPPLYYTSLRMFKRFKSNPSTTIANLSLSQIYIDSFTDHLFCKRDFLEFDRTYFIVASGIVSGTDVDPTQTGKLSFGCFKNGTGRTSISGYSVNGDGFQIENWDITKFTYLANVMITTGKTSNVGLTTETNISLSNAIGKISATQTTFFLNVKVKKLMSGDYSFELTELDFNYAVKKSLISFNFKQGGVSFIGFSTFPAGTTNIANSLRLDMNNY